MPIDLKPYPANWGEVRREIPARAGNRCERCGVPNHQIVPTVAHLDHDTTDNDPQNPAALCRRCHNRYDAPMRAQRRKERRRATTALAGRT